MINTGVPVPISDQRYALAPVAIPCAHVHAQQECGGGFGTSTDLRSHARPPLCVFSSLPTPSDNHQDRRLVRASGRNQRCRIRGHSALFVKRGRSREAYLFATIKKCWENRYEKGGRRPPVADHSPRTYKDTKNLVHFTDSASSTDFPPRRQVV